MTSISIRDLLVFTRYPLPGEVKTRLIPAIGAEAAADLQREMTEFTVDQARKTGARVEIRHTGGSLRQMRDWLGADGAYVEQGEGNLGDRLARAVDERFAAGGRRVAVVGCDCPDNRAANMAACFEALEQHPWAIGPATDGGYYMLGLNRPTPSLFTNIDWGGDRVLAQTLAAADEPPYVLPEMRDVDTIEDVPARISVIIPALNEAQAIGESIASVKQGFHAECIVVDGGSTDQTDARALEHGARLVRSAPGRAIQMNRGAEVASGEILLFLHADTTLPEAWDRTVREALAEPRVALGAFRLRVRERLPGIAWIERGADIRSRRFHRPYGDQALFTQAAHFRHVGGFPEVPIMEDVELVRKLRRCGRVVTVPQAIVTSVRRWRRLGIPRAFAINQIIVVGYWLGISPRRLKRWYVNASNPK